MNFKILNNVTIAAILISLAVITRIIPHPWSFTCVGAVLLFSTFYFKNRKISFLIPITIMLCSDLCLLYLQHKPFAGVYIYLCWLVYIPISVLFIKKIEIKNVALAGISGATLFFITSNFLVWIQGGGLGYTYNLTGLINCYIAAIPFYLNAMAGNLVWSAIIFGIYELSQESIKKLIPLIMMHKKR